MNLSAVSEYTYTDIDCIQLMNLSAVSEYTYTYIDCIQLMDLSAVSEYTYTERKMFNMFWSSLSRRVMFWNRWLTRYVWGDTPAR